jgi:hypothetical protein
MPVLSGRERPARRRAHADHRTELVHVGGFVAVAAAIFWRREIRTAAGAPATDPRW